MIKTNQLMQAIGLYAVIHLVFVVFATLLSAANAGTLEEYIQSVPPSEIMAGGEVYGDLLDGHAIAPVLKGSKTIGHVFLNTDFSGAIGYSGKPIFILIGLDLIGRVTGAKLVAHTEPIVLAGIPEEKIVKFIDGYKDLNIPQIAKSTTHSPPPADIVSGATVTVLVIDDSIKRASTRVARILNAGGLAGPGTKTATIKRTLKRSAGEIEDWQTLLGNGSVRRLRLAVGDINQAFSLTGNEKAIARADSSPSDELFIDFYAASLAVDSVARSLLGEAEFKHMKSRLKPDQEAFLFMGNGRYSFKGSGYVRGGIFDRITVVQGETTVRFRDRGHKRLGDVLAEGAPRFREIGLFKTPKDVKLDPADPWFIQLLVHREIGALSKVFVNFDLGYQMPAQFVDVEKIVSPSSNTVPTLDTKTRAAEDLAARDELWKRIWSQKLVSVSILVAAISLLTIVFFFQNFLVLSATWTNRVRIAFLVFTLFWIGFYAQAQLSVVNVFVFANALLGTFRWEFFLLEPLIFILWCSVAVAIIFWGRGAYCGWLCPFGALQELLNKIAKWFKVPQITLPWGLHERLWPIKYLIFLGLLGVSAYSLALAEHLAEIEPFKTSIILKFNRSWPYLLFVGVLLSAGLFIERFYCRYLCPLGAALAIPARMAMFHWLKRYRNCGDPCHRCAQDCMVQAIDPLGDINPNECLHCLNCQQMYYNEDLCPVVIHQLAKAQKGKPDSQKLPNLEEAKTLFRRPRRLGRERTIED